MWLGKNHQLQRFTDDHLKMNSGLVLLLVAALYTAGCVNAVDITVKDTKKAVKKLLGNSMVELIQTCKKPTSIEFNLKAEMVLL